MKRSIHDSSQDRPREGQCDLHIHSNHSDGLLSPEQVVQRSKEVGLAAIAISDHDAVSAIDPAKLVGKRLGVEVVPAIEMSCLHRKMDVHILGYYLDYHNPDLVAFLTRVQAERLERARKIVAKLNQQGLALDVSRVLEIAHGGALGRPHIAQALLERGHVKTMDEAFMKFIGYHSPAYVPKMEIAPVEGIEFIKKFGGIPVAAHPGTYEDDELLNDLIASGLLGIEVYHPDHSAGMSERYLEIALKNDLLVTGGSDCHGGRKGRIFLGDTRIPYRYLAEMKKRKGIA